MPKKSIRQIAAKPARPLKKAVFYERFRKKQGYQSPLERYYLTVQSAALNFGPASPRDSLLIAAEYALCRNIGSRF